MRRAIGSASRDRLKVIHALGWYFPESSGGTEVYVDGLAKHLIACGVDSSIVAADGDGPARDYRWNGVPVHRYAVPEPTREEIAGAHPHARFAEFEEWLRSQEVDVYHQHSWTRGCGFGHLKVAKRLGLQTVVTVHVPGLICLRGTMMLDGKGPCDGKVDVERCTRCWGESRGIPSALANWQGRNPMTSQTVGQLLPDSRLQTAMLTPRLVARRLVELDDLGREADCVVAVCRWLYDALLINGLPPEKLVYCAQGIDVPAEFEPIAKSDAEDRPLRVGFLGRWDPTKGVHTLVDAFRRLPATVRAELHVHGMPGDASYEQSVRAVARNDPRIRFAAPLGRDEILPALAGFDLIAVPSQWLETGPLVVLEAFAAGTPVLGSDLGGIAELVTHGANGWLVPSADVAMWTRAIADFAATPPAGRPRPSTAPRSCGQIGQEMSALYRQLVRADAPQSALSVSLCE